MSTTLPDHSGRPPLPKTFAHSTPQPILQYQGAEALLYRTTFLFAEQAHRPPPESPSHSSFGKPIPAALKHRPSKPYRHPTLDAKLTRHRILAEARVLARLRREGVAVPALLALDWEVPEAADSGGANGGWMLMEWIEGETVRAVLDRELGAYVARVEGGEGAAVSPAEGAAGVAEGEEVLVRLMRRIGALVGRIHELGVVHGDLTTSNLMVRRSAATGDGDLGRSQVQADPEVVVLDFGLAGTSIQDEDRAVDLYVLERAFGSTHPRTEGLFGEVLKAYGASYKAAKVTLKRLEEVRMRGRKKIMIG